MPQEFDLNTWCDAIEGLAADVLAGIVRATPIADRDGEAEVLVRRPSVRTWDEADRFAFRFKGGQRSCMVRIQQGVDHYSVLVPVEPSEVIGFIARYMARSGGGGVFVQPDATIA